MSICFTPPVFRSSTVSLSFSLALSLCLHLSLFLFFSLSLDLSRSLRTCVVEDGSNFLRRTRPGHHRDW